MAGDSPCPLVNPLIVLDDLAIELEDLTIELDDLVVKLDDLPNKLDDPPWNLDILPSGSITLLGVSHVLLGELENPSTLLVFRVISLYASPPVLELAVFLSTLEFDREILRRDPRDRLSPLRLVVLKEGS
eukprot:201578-Amorphochlora_amoeboformis.AAC.1